MQIPINEPLDFNRWLKQNRADRRLSLQGLANRTGISTAQFSNYNHMYYSPTLANAIRIVDALGGRLVIIIGEDENE